MQENIAFLSYKTMNIFNKNSMNIPIFIEYKTTIKRVFPALFLMCSYKVCFW